MLEEKKLHGWFKTTPPITLQKEKRRECPVLISVVSRSAPSAAYRRSYTVATATKHTLHTTPACSPGKPAPHVFPVASPLKQEASLWARSEMQAAPASHKCCVFLLPHQLVTTPGMTWRVTSVQEIASHPEGSPREGHGEEICPSY